MAQQQSPWLEGAYGWNFGEGGWNTGMDSNLLKFSFLFDRNVDSIVASLPAAVNGQAHYLTTDNRLYFAVGTSYFSTPVPKWFTVFVRSTGQTYQYNGTSLVQVDSSVQLDSRLDAVELTVSNLGTAAFEDTEFFATQSELDIAEAVSAAYTDTLRSDLADPSTPTNGAGMVGWEGATVADVLRHSINQYGTISGVDDSAAAAAMIADLNMLVVPEGVTAAIKNIELFDGTQVLVKGILKLPDAASDFDRMIHAAGRSGLVVDISEINGNAAGQSGLIGTHLVYLTNCQSPVVNVRYAHDHYYDVSAPATSVDGIRDASTGAVFLYQCDKAEVSIGLLENWGREGVQLRDCTGSSALLGHAQGSDTGGEYSGLQVSGENNSILRASVDSAGASAVGFDTINGELSNVLATNTRENHGVNFGHTGFPASGSTASNIVVDGAFRHGISVGASTQDLGISGFTIKNAGELGLNASDGVLRLRASTGLIETCGQFNINAFAAEMQVRNTRYSALDQRSIRVDSVTGVFVAGETVTASGGATGVVRKVLRDRTGTTQILFLNSITGTWLATETVSGGTSSATGTVGLASIPTAKRELSGGLIVEESSFATGGLGSVTKFSDGTAIYRHTVAVVATADTLATVTTLFPSTIAWVGSAPNVSVEVVAISSTDAFNINRLSCTRTLSDFSIKLNASVTQTYSVDVIAIGRWK